MLAVEALASFFSVLPHATNDAASALLPATPQLKRNFKLLKISWSAVYGLFDSFEYAAVACTMLKDNYPQVFIAKTV